MMPLSTMWNVDRTIDANGSSPVAERILECWTYDTGSIRFFRSSANFLYVFRINGKHHFLRFADSSERSREAIEAEVDLLSWLGGAGIDVTLPVASRHGHLVERIETRWGTFHAVVFPTLAGEQFEISDLDDSGFRRWGAALGAVHAALATYPGGNTTTRPTWRHHLDMIRATLPKEAPALHSEFADVAGELAALPQSPGPMV